LKIKKNSPDAWNADEDLDVEVEVEVKVNTNENKQKNKNANKQNNNKENSKNGKYSISAGWVSEVDLYRKKIYENNSILLRNFLFEHYSNNKTINTTINNKKNVNKIKIKNNKNNQYMDDDNNKKKNVNNFYFNSTTLNSKWFTALLSDFKNFENHYNYNYYDNNNNYNNNNNINNDNNNNNNNNNYNNNNNNNNNNENNNNNNNEILNKKISNFLQKHANTNIPIFSSADKVVDFFLLKNVSSFENSNFKQKNSNMEHIYFNDAIQVFFIFF
jgi:hypothetical protein